MGNLNANRPRLVYCLGMCHKLNVYKHKVCQVMTATNVLGGCCVAGERLKGRFQTLRNTSIPRNSFSKAYSWKGRTTHTCTNIIIGIIYIIHYQVPSVHYIIITKMLVKCWRACTSSCFESDILKTSVEESGNSIISCTWEHPVHIENTYMYIHPEHPVHIENNMLIIYEPVCA